MGVVDDARRQATNLARKAQEAARAGQGKVKEAAARRRAHVLLRRLGEQAYAEKTGRTTGDTAGHVERILADLRAHEDRHGPLVAGHPPSARASEGTPSAGSEEAGPAGDTLK
jgi:hypothetical protein